MEFVFSLHHKLDSRPTIFSSLHGRGSKPKSYYFINAQGLYLV